MKRTLLGARSMLALGVLLLGCPPSEQQKASPSSSSSASPSSSSKGCTKFGQSCEVSPGKLGTCVQRSDCNEPVGCFVCQSQH